MGTAYAVEMAMMMDLIGRHGSPSVFAEVEMGIGKVLLDKQNSDMVHARMYLTVMAFAHRVHILGKPIHELTSAAIRELNAESGCPAWIPARESGDGPNNAETIKFDAILPSVEELVT
jgi:hypothetical protein